MIFFATWKVGNEDRCKRFYTVDQLFEWLQEMKANSGWPEQLCIFKAEAIFDGSM